MQRAILALRVLLSLAVSLCFFLVGYLAHAQEGRRRLDERPKSSQEVCGYTLKPGAVRVFSETSSRIELSQVIGNPDHLADRIFDTAVCAFQVEHPEFTDVAIEQIIITPHTDCGVGPVNDEVQSVLLRHRRK